MDMQNIIAVIRENRVLFTSLADQEAANDCLGFQEILHSVLNGHVIEDYQEDKPYPNRWIDWKMRVKQ